MPSTYRLVTPLPLFVLLSWGWYFGQEALAMPEGVTKFCETYPDTQSCAQPVDCTFCHSGVPGLNPYGSSLQTSLTEQPGYDKSQFSTSISNALQAIENLDSDNDNSNNIKEIMSGSEPGNPTSFPKADPGQQPLENPYYKLNQYDAKFAFRRLTITYCGTSPTFNEYKAIEDASDPKPLMHMKLDGCLQGAFWLEKALPRLADWRINPVKPVGAEGDIVLADYQWDYRLFVYVLSGDRDARDLLLAQYHIDEDGNKVEGVIPATIPPEFPGLFGGTRIVIGTGQPLQPERRVGMISTQWYFVQNNMFAELPRNAAAQAYRSYLGLDFAKGEGIFQVQGEPRDLDNKGVKQAECAGCHAPLDSVTYPFSAYNGIEPNLGGFFFNNTGKFNPQRVSWEKNGYVLGQPVNDLIEWARVAANSVEFRINLAAMFYEQALGRKPNKKSEEFIGLYESILSDNYVANALIHNLIDTQAFGSP